MGNALVETFVTEMESLEECFVKIMSWQDRWAQYRDAIINAENVDAKQAMRLVLTSLKFDMFVQHMSSIDKDVMRKREEGQVPDTKLFDAVENDDNAQVYMDLVDDAIKDFQDKMGGHDTLEEEE